MDLVKSPVNATQAEARARILRAAHMPAPAQVGWARDVTLVVTTVARPGCVAQYLESARQTFPAVPIVVCEASDAPLFEDDVLLGQHIRWRHVPPKGGQGVGAARNHALACVQTPLFFLCDDDHLLGPHCELARMVSFMWRRQYDIAGGCQGPNNYGTAVLHCDSGILRQRLYAHHGLIEPGAVRCDRVSNGFMGRTATVSQVGWEAPVHGDEHAEFFWRAKVAGLKVAQLSRTYVKPNHSHEEPPTWWVPLLRPWLAHADSTYAQRRQGGSDPRSKAAYKTFVLQKDGLTAMARHAQWRDKRALLRLMNRL